MIPHIAIEPPGFRNADWPANDVRHWDSSGTESALLQSKPPDERTAT